MRRTFERVLAGALLTAVIASPAGAAEPRKQARGAEVAGGLSKASLAKLRSSDPAEIGAGLDDARLAGPKATAAVAPIAALLGAGLPYRLAEAAIDTLGDIGAPDGAAAIAPYASHRDLKVRRAAVRALARSVGAQGTAVASATLRASLSDPDGLVRASAATGLGALRARGAVPDLFLALDRKVYEAAVSIGQLCDAAECEAFMGRLGKIPLDVLTTAVDQILFRPATELGDDVKIGIVDRVRDLGTRDANKFLRDVAARWPKGGSAKVRSELDSAINATMSSPGGEP